MGSDNTFLKYFITEDIYVLDEKEETTETVESVTIIEPDQVDNTEDSGLGTVELTDVEEPKEEYREPEKPKPTSETCVVLKNMEDRSDETLQKILAAIKIHTPDYVDQLDFLSGHKNYLIFGDFSEKEKYVIHESEGVRLLISDEVPMLKTEESLKRKLWDQLKGMFLK